MKILSVAWECPRGFYGGLGMFVKNLLPELASFGEVLHLCLFGDYPIHPVKESGFVVYRVSDIIVSRERAVKFASALELAREHKRVSEADVVITHDVHAAPYVLSAGEIGVKSVFYLHTVFGTGLERDAVETATKLCTNSRLTERIVREILSPTARAEVVYPAPPRREVGDRAGRSLGLGRYVLVFTRNQPNKWSREQIINLLKTAKRHGAKLVVAGQGFSYSDIGLSDPDLIVLGGVDEETKRILMRESELIVYPSLIEPFGIVPLEAISENRPVVVSSRAGVSEVLPEEAREEPEKIHEKVDQLLGYREQLEELLEKERRSWIMKRTWREVAEEILRNL